MYGVTSLPFTASAYTVTYCVGVMMTEQNFRKYQSRSAKRSGELKLKHALDSADQLTADHTKISSNELLKQTKLIFLGAHSC